MEKGNFTLVVGRSYFLRYPGSNRPYKVKLLEIHSRTFAYLGFKKYKPKEINKEGIICGCNNNRYKIFPPRSDIKIGGVYRKSLEVLVFPGAKLADKAPSLFSDVKVMFSSGKVNVYPIGYLYKTWKKALEAGDNLEGGIGK